MSKIVDIVARQIIDSRGYPTVEVEVVSEMGAKGRASVPSGASTGRYEAVDLRDNDSNYFMGKSVLKACRTVEEQIMPLLLGIDVQEQRSIDYTMIDADNSANKANFGANAVLAVSLACAKTAAIELDLPLYRYIGGPNAHVLPVPMMNILNGGAHADNKLDFQEFMIVPLEAKTFSDAIRMGTDVFHTLKKVLRSKGLSTNVGDEGGFAPDLRTNEEAIELLLEAIQKAGYKAGRDISIALDAAVSELYDRKKKRYVFKKSTGSSLSSDQLVNYWENLVKKYPICSIEDGMSEDDWAGWVKLTKSIGEFIQLVGDDLFVTNTDRIKMGIEKGAANAVIIKLNQIGTLTETLDAIRLAQCNKMNCVISHRSGETEDTTIADLAVALNLGQIKTGSLSRTDRTAKYNQLLRIEEELEGFSYYPGKYIFDK